jgi:hypothetical protein
MRRRVKVPTRKYGEWGIQRLVDVDDTDTQEEA